MNEKDNKVLRVLARQYRNSASAATEIINLQSIMNLPKGTEHFLTDIHGEYEQFNHVLKNGSGYVRKKIDEEFGNTISSRDKRSLATLIYYPEEKLEIVEKEEDHPYHHPNRPRPSVYHCSESSDPVSGHRPSPYCG